MALDATVYLSVGDGTASGDYIDLNDGTNYEIEFWDFSRPFDRRFKSNGRAVTLGISVFGNTPTGLLDKLQAIETKLGQARLAAANPQGGHSGVTLGVKLESASGIVYFDVLNGTSSMSREALRSIMLDQGMALWSNRTQGLVLELECLPYARGEAYTLNSGGAFTINKAGGFTAYEAAIKGDVPALATITVTDNSSGVVLNKLLMSHKSQPDLDSGDWDGVVDCAADTDGTLTGSFTNAVDSDYAGDSSLLFSDGWSAVAQATPGTPYADQAGVYDVYGRVYDSLSVPQPPRNVTISTYSTGGSMPPGTYTIVVTTITAAGESMPSDPITIRLASPIDEFTVAWDAPLVSATPTNYRVYWKRDTNDWKYEQTSTSATSWNVDSEGAATTADPPDEPAALSSEFRGQAGMSSGTTMMDGKSVTARLSNATWEAVRLFSGITLPPAALEEGGTVEQWRVNVNAARRDWSTAPAVRVDALWLLPSENIVEVEYLGLDLATTRKWVIGRTRHGNPHGVLRSKADDSEQGRVSVSNPPVLGPGDTQIVFMPLVEGGEFDVSSVSLSVSIEVVPRYSFLRGTS